jgi:hypothetical protein
MPQYSWNTAKVDIKQQSINQLWIWLNKETFFVFLAKVIFLYLDIKNNDGISCWQIIVIHICFFVINYNMIFT